mgnify:CR=1 FL=1
MVNLSKKHLKMFGMNYLKYRYKMKLFEAKQILKKNGYRLVEDKYTDLMDAEDDYSETNDIITVDYIDKDNYEDYIDKTLNVKDYVDLSELGLTKLPIRFIKVDGKFDCSNNYLTTLEGSPKEVGGDFWCSDNKLTNLKEAPEKVGGFFDCSYNKLTNLKGAPREVGGTFWCFRNELTSLEGAPEIVGNSFHCQNNEVQFTRDEVKDYCNVKGYIIVK